MRSHDWRRAGLLALGLVMLLASPEALAQRSVKERRGLAPVPTLARCGKVAIVIDGGGVSGDTVHQTADEMAATLQAVGFSTLLRYSNLATATEDYLTRDRLFEILKSITAQARTLGGDCCIELFFYVMAHGIEKDPQQGRFFLEPLPGRVSGGEVQYGEIYDSIAQGADASHGGSSPIIVTMLFDNCYGGRAITNYKRTLSVLGQHLCGLTVMTGTDALSDNWAGNNILLNSASQDFMQGAGTDQNGDGVFGTLVDLWLKMLADSGGKALMQAVGKVSAFWLGPPP